MVDLAEGHVAALNHIEHSAKPYCDPINLGTGRGTSVLEMVKVLQGVGLLRCVAILRCSSS